MNHFNLCTTIRFYYALGVFKSMCLFPIVSKYLFDIMNTNYTLWVPKQKVIHVHYELCIYTTSIIC